MFLFKASTYLEELNKFSPLIYSSCIKAMENSIIETDFIRPEKNIFDSCPSDSIDYAVMEKTTKAVVVPVNIGWTDLGSWSALWDISDKDQDGNAINGDVLTFDTRNSYIRTESQLITTVGVEHLAIVATKDAIMV